MTAPDERAAPGVDHTAEEQPPTPLYWRLLRLKHVHPNGWQRALLVEGVFALAAVLTLADVATAWTLVVLPLSVALVVKLNDIVAGLLAPAARDDDVVRRGHGDPPTAT